MTADLVLYPESHREPQESLEQERRSDVCLLNIMLVAERRNKQPELGRGGGVGCESRKVS